MLKNQNGITLVALVVTIVVLIILATISISVAINSGIIGEASKAKGVTLNQEKKWDETDKNITAYLQYQFEQITSNNAD